MARHLLLATLKVSIKCVCVPPARDSLLTVADRRFHYEGKAATVQLLS